MLVAAWAAALDIPAPRKILQLSPAASGAHPRAG
jgi:hypothetical protein